MKVALNRDVLAGAGDVALELNVSSELALAIARNEPLPKPAEPVILGSADFSVESGKALALGSGTTQVTFGAGASARFGLFAQPGQLRDAIVDGGDLAESIEDALSFDNGSTTPFLLLRLGYDVNATASGAMALGTAGTLAFGANVARQGLFATIHQPDGTRGSRDAIADLARMVRLPRQVKTVDHLLPGTWIVAEADGSVGLRAEVKFGHDLSWVRESALGTLKGDIGLKVAAGVSAALGFSAAGKYAIVVSRESPASNDQRLRVRLFKLRMHQWDFAFRAEATVTPVAGILPEQLDDFLKGVLGVHGVQVVASLGKVKDWTDPEQPLFGPFVNLAADEARQIISRITGVADVVAGFNEAKSKLQRLFDTWHALPADVTSRLLKLTENSNAVTLVRDAAQRLADADANAVKDFLREKLSDVAFLRSPAGALIEKLAVKGLFAALTNSDLLAELQQRARQLLELLDLGLVEGLLTRLQADVNKRLALDQIEKAVAAADPAKLDAWMRARLEDFLEEKLVGQHGVAALNDLRAAIRKLLETAPELYKRAVAALRRDYQFSITSTYQKATTTTALIDVEFDFAVQDSEAEEALRLCLLGRFDDLIDVVRRGVTLHEGVLTHGIRRETNVTIAMPFFERKTTHINQVLASLKAPTQVGGQVFYLLEASDIVTVKNEHSASLTISMQIAQDSDTDVRVHDANSASYVQSLDTALFDTSVEELRDYAGPFVQPLFGEELKGNFQGWLQDAFGSASSLGHALLALDVTLPQEACLAWLKAPGAKNSEVYQNLSIALQTRFKQLLHDTYFHRVQSYRDVGFGSDAFTVLLFTSLPAATSARVKNDRVQIAPADFADPKKAYWDHVNRGLRSKMAFSEPTTATLARRLAAARRRVQAARDPDNITSFYKDSQLSTIIKSALESPLLESLLFVESEMVEQARAAALTMAAFEASKRKDPAAARKALAKFGAKVTEAFNERLGNVAVGGALRPLGALMFIAAVEAFDPSLALGASAMLNIIDVRDDIKFPPDRFPDHDAVAEADIVRSETLVHAART